MQYEKSISYTGIGSSPFSFFLPMAPPPHLTRIYYFFSETSHGLMTFISAFPTWYLRINADTPSIVTINGISKRYRRDIEGIAVVIRTFVNLRIFVFFVRNILSSPHRENLCKPSSLRFLCVKHFFFPS